MLVVVQMFNDVIWYIGRRPLSRIFYIILPNCSFYYFFSLFFSFFSLTGSFFIPLFPLFLCFFVFFQSDPKDWGFFSGQTRLFVYIYFFFWLYSSLFSIITYTVICNRSNNM